MSGQREAPQDLLAQLVTAGWVVQGEPLPFRRDAQWWRRPRALHQLKHPAVPAVILARFDRSGRLRGVLTYSYMEPENDGTFFSAQTELPETAAELGAALPRTAATADAVPGAVVRLRSR